jgi:hypothetical protein
MEPEQILKKYSAQLVLYGRLAESLANCVRVDEVKEIRNRAQAIEIYAAQAKNLEMEFKAVRIRLRAERRCGKLLKKMKDNGTRHSGHGDQIAESPDVTPLPTLADLGISKRQSADWQKLADIPLERFEERLGGDYPNTANMIRFELPREPGGSGKWFYTEVDDPQGAYFSEYEEWRREWVGMPEFVQPEVRPFAQIVVRFTSQEGLDEFSRRIEQKCTLRTKSLWFPPVPRGVDSGKHYVEEG